MLLGKLGNTLQLTEVPALDLFCLFACLFHAAFTRCKLVFTLFKGINLTLKGLFFLLQSSFLGSFTRVAIACAETQAPVLATLPYGKRHQQELRAESTVSFTWDPEDAVVLDIQQA